MFNVGLGFMAFGLLLWLYERLTAVMASKQLTATAHIVGYKQFPNDKTITDDTIVRGQNFSWLRVVSFKNILTGQMVEMYSNPGVVNPEPIGTEITIRFNPKMTDPVRDYAWVTGGMRSVNTVAMTSFSIGLVTFIILLFAPKPSPLHFILVVPAFLIVFIAAYISIWRQPNQ